MRPYTIARFTILHVSSFVELTFEADQLPETFDFASTISELLTSVKRSGARTMLRGVTFERPPQGSPASRRVPLKPRRGGNGFGRLDPAKLVGKITEGRNQTQSRDRGLLG